MKRRILAVALALALLGPTAATPATTESIRLLLIGNSLMRGIKRPLSSMLAEIGIDAQIKTLAPGTWTLERHASSLLTENRIEARAWDFVIIQGKAIGLSDDNYPALRTLNDKINAAAATFGADTQVILSMTWRDRGVGPERYDTLHGFPGGTFGYIPIAFELDVPVAPIGWAIRNGLLLGTLPVDLWKGGKGRHLSNYGAYLAASVVYAVMRKETPVGAYAKERFDPATILYLQTLADSTVFGDPAEWNLDLLP
jgi:hypothetical protein